MPNTTHLRICLSERVPWCMPCWLLSLKSFVIYFDCCKSHCPCQIQICGTFWLPVAWAWHHFCTLSWAVDEYQLPTLLFPQKTCNSLNWQVGPFVQMGYHVELLQLCFCAYAWSYMTVSTRNICCICQQYLKTEGLCILNWIKPLNFFIHPGSLIFWWHL